MKRNGMVDLGNLASIHGPGGHRRAKGTVGRPNHVEKQLVILLKSKFMDSYSFGISDNGFYKYKWAQLDYKMTRNPTCNYP